MVGGSILEYDKEGVYLAKMPNGGGALKQLGGKGRA